MPVMPDDSPTPSPPFDPSGGAPSESRNLPALIPRPKAQEGDGFLVRLARTLFSGWKSGPTRADIEVVLEATGPGEAGVSPEERTMIRNILALRGRRIEDVMVPRGDIVAVQQEMPLGELVKVFQKAGHSRLVAYNDTLDDPTGMVHIRDLIAFMTAQATVTVDKPSKRRKSRPAGLDLAAIDLTARLSSTGNMREMLVVPPSMPALDLLEKMQPTRNHLELVVDEYGGTDGLVSMEDIVEQIVGEIGDEHDEDELPAVVRQPDGSFVADARASLDDVTDAVGVAFDVGDAAEEVDTIGGYLMTQVGRLPLRGELVPGPTGFEIEVLDSDPRRIKKVRIHRSKDRAIEREREARRHAAEMASHPIAPSADASAPDSSKSSPQVFDPNMPRRP
jgi:CBS domain containing-hemolysin-like protein